MPVRTKQDRRRTRLLEEHRRHFHRVTQLLGMEDITLPTDEAWSHRAELWLNNRESLSLCLNADGLDLWLNVQIDKDGWVMSPLTIFRLPERPLYKPWLEDSSLLAPPIPTLRDFLCRARYAWENLKPAEVRRSLRLATAMAVILTPDP
jgi:hypothetical protein